VDGAANRDPDKTTRTASASGGNTGNTVGSVQGDATAVKGLSNASSSVTATAAATGSGTLTSHSHGVTDGGHVHSIAHDHGAFTSGAGSAHNHGAGSYATSIGLSGSAPSLTGSTTFASSTHKHLGTTGVSDQKYFVRTNGGQITSVSNSPLGSSNTYSGSGNIDVSYTGNNDANASVGITGGSYSLTGANTVSGTSADESAHTHSIDVPNFTGNSTSATTGLSVNTANIDHTHSVSGTAAAQALSGDSETRPLNANVNYIIKV